LFIDWLMLVSIQAPPCHAGLAKEWDLCIPP
jgi:hypothetical protein